MDGSDPTPDKAVFTPAMIGALAHLYRGEVYRSTVWRNRLDATTNWAVVATGIALSVTFSSAAASPLPLALVGLLVAVFLYIEARRYRFFDFWRIRAHVLELHFFGPMLLGQGVKTDNGWNEILYKDYFRPNLHITFMESVGRRLRYNSPTSPRGPGADPCPRSIQRRSPPMSRRSARNCGPSRSCATSSTSTTANSRCWPRSTTCSA